VVCTPFQEGSTPLVVKVQGRVIANDKVRKGICDRKGGRYSNLVSIHDTSVLERRKLNSSVLFKVVNVIYERELL
jgi:hypothetical protein